MQKISSLLKIEKKKSHSERADLLESILVEINRERLGTKYKPMSPRVLAIKLSHLSKADLYYLISCARDYRDRHGSFSKYVFGVIKVK
jgi:hypothetical protein